MAPDETVDGRRWTRRFWGLLGLVTLLRVAYLALAPLDLAGDEAYYWDWSRRPAWCYYSKPPMVAWVMGASTSFFGSSPFGVRLPACLFASAGTWAVFAIGRRLFDARVGFFAAAAALAGPGAVALGLVMTIDPPLVLSWNLALWFLVRARGGDGAGWWLAAGLALAAGILSKATMLVLVVLWPFLVRTERGRSPLALLPLFFALLALVPIVWWNVANDWVMFAHSAAHFPAEERGLLHLEPVRFLEFLGSQLGVVSPVTWFLVAAVGVGLARGPARRDPRVRLLLMTGALPLAGILLVALRQRVHGNWSAPFYTALAVLVAAWACGNLSAGAWIDRRRNLFVPGLVLGAVLAVTTYAFPIVAQHTSLGGGPSDPTARIRGWSDLGRAIAPTWRSLADERPTLVLSPSRQLAAQLAFVLPGQPRTFRWSEGGVTTQYEVWDGPLASRDSEYVPGGEPLDALVVLHRGEEPSASLVAAFEELTELPEVAVPLGTRHVRALRLFHGRGLRHWPDPAAP